MAMTTGVFLSFCLMASGIYAFNDVLDVDNDRRHPRKRKRPVALGTIPKSTAIAISGLLVIMSLGLAKAISFKTVAVLLIYFIANVLYSLKLKEIVILDVILIAAGYVLRMFAGATISSQVPSHWIILTTFFLSLFLGFAKRRAELSFLFAQWGPQRSVLSEYSRSLLDHILASTMAVTIICYSLYASSDYAQLRFHTDKLIYTIPFVVFGIFRYFQQMKMAKKGEDPTEVLLTDKPTWINLILWAIACILIIYP